MEFCDISILIDERKSLLGFFFFLFLLRYSDVSYSKISGIGIRVEGSDFCRGLLFEGKKSVENFASYASYRVEPLLSFVDALEGSFCSLLFF